MKRTTITWAGVILLVFAGIVFAAKWSDYDSMTAGTLVDADTFMVLDVSDTTMATTGTQYQYPWSVLKADAKTYFDTLYEDGLGVPVGDDYVLSSKIDGTRSWIAPSADDFDPTKPGPIGGTTPGSGKFTTLSAGGDEVEPTGEFTVDADGNVTAASVTVSKVDGTPGALRMYEGTTDEVLTAGFRGPAALGASAAYEGQFPNAGPAPQSGAYAVQGWAAEDTNGDGTADDPFVHPITFVTIGAKHSRSVTILGAVADTDDFAFWRTPYAITITNTHCTQKGGTNVIGQFTICSSAGADCVDVDVANITCSTSNVDGVVDSESTGLDNAPAGAYIGWKTHEVTGTTTSFVATFEYTID